MVCAFCLIESCDSYFSSYCARCHRLQRMLHLFGGEKIMSVCESVLIVDKEQQEVQIKQELKQELTTRVHNLRARKETEEK